MATILRIIREYIIDGVKVSFGIMAKGGESRANYFKAADKIDYPGAFDILNLDWFYPDLTVTQLRIV